MVSSVSLGISLIALVIVVVVKKLKIANSSNSSKKTPFIAIILVFIPIWLMTPIFEIMGGKSVGKFLTLFLLGYYVLTKETVLQKIDTYRYLLLNSFIVLNITRLVLFATYDYNGGVLYNCVISLIGWLGILAIIGIGRHSLNFANRICTYFTLGSFPIYILHQSALVTIGYAVIVYASNMQIPLQFTIIMLASFIATIMVYEIIKRIPAIRVLFGMKFSTKGKT